jgi:transposase
MASVHVERLDHLGLMACMIQDVGLIGMIDARLIPGAQAEITPGEAVAGMILHGLGFANRPRSLTPQFFANQPLDRLVRAGVEAPMCNRCKLGRTLDELHAYGCDLLFSELALAVCAQEGIAQRFHHLDTTSVARSGDSVPERAEQAIRLTHGSSQDHRPDLKPAVLELIVSPDGGVPLVSKRGDGHASATQLFQERAQALIKAVASAPTPRYLVADAKRYTEDTAATLATLGFITRMPGTRKLVSQVISPALQWGTWQELNDPTRYPCLAWCHDGIAQRWLVVSSQAALERAEARVTNAHQRAWATLEQQLVHWQATRVETPEAAQAARSVLAQSWRSHPVDTTGVLAHKRDAGKGRPTPTSPITSMDWQIRVQARPDQERRAWRKPQGACVVLGTTSDASPVSDLQVIQAYKAQSQVESGFRLLQDPVFLVSSRLVKKPCRIHGWLMVMT